MRAPSLPDLFSEAARALFSLIVTNLDAVQTVETVEVRLPADDVEYLFFDWLNELLFTFETRRILFSEFQVAISDDGLVGTGCGETLDADRHEADHEVKAITYHGLLVEKQTDGWLAEFIVDI